MLTFWRQLTIGNPIEIDGVGLHTGVNVHIRLIPASAGTGIVFRRTDLGNFEIEAKAKNVAHVSYATSLMKKGVLISTVEHLLSAIASEGVDNVVVEIDNLEVPILDGSAQPFVNAIRKVGIKSQRAQRQFIKIIKPIEVSDARKRISVYPAQRFQVTCRIAFDHPLIGEQSVEFDPAENDFAAEIAPARTFGFADEVEMLRKSGLVRGGSLENAIVLTKTGLLNVEGLRFPDEFCRHKALDLIGDLKLLGRPLIGHVVAERAGHAMHVALVNAILKEKDSWKLIHAVDESIDAGENATDQVPMTVGSL